MTDPVPLSDLVAGARHRAGIDALLGALGFEPCNDDVPRPAWPAYGLPDPADVAALAVAGRAGTLDALLIEFRGPVPLERMAGLTGAIRARNPVRLHLFVLRQPGQLMLATHGMEGDFRHLTLEPDRIRSSDIDALADMVPRRGEAGLALAVLHARALDRTRVTRSFFRDFRAHRAAVAAAFSGLPPDAARERARLAILFLCRLTFLYFLQRRGTLCGDDRYMVRLLNEGVRDGGASFFRARLMPLFFGALNRPVAERSADARDLGDLPYLNGGLFEPDALERAFPDLDLPDPVVRAVFDGLLERYRFTSREAGAGAGYGVDPEVLGRVFEGLMAPGQRGETGSFYTPAPVVNRVVREGLTEYMRAACPDLALDQASGRPGRLPAEGRYRVRRSLERLRVLDPACGSGAFLLGALHHLAGALEAVSDNPELNAGVRREIVARSLHGVDLLDDAALLCSLRLWLALSEADREVRPLPNLDRRIRQGDALIDPLDLPHTDATDGPYRSPLLDPHVRSAYRAVAPASRRYLESEPAERASARTDLAAAERTLARRWIERLRRRHDEQARRLEAEAADRDLFGDVPDPARRARAALQRAERRQREIEHAARELEEQGALPFFSFGVHFADAGGAFDLIVSNPPWIRAHRWPDRLRRIAAQHYEVCRSPGWPAAATLVGSTAAAGAQLDLSLLFLERCCRLLAPGGVLAVLIPAKAMRALYGGSARRMLLRDLEFALIEDHALDQRSIFRADAFAAVLVARKPKTNGARPTPSAGVRVRMVRRGVDALEFRVRPADLPLFQDDPASPWILAPPDAAGVLRAMQRSGPPLGRHEGLGVRRGVMTGANDVLVMTRVAPKLGGLARVEAAGYATARGKGAPGRIAGRYRAYVETSGLRPLVRGGDIDSFRFEPRAHVVWCHDDQGRPADVPPRLARYLARHRDVLERRPGWRQGLPLGSLFRLSPDTVRPKVAWHDLSDTLRAVALPARIAFDGAERELIPLNTVYFLPVDQERDALLLAAIFNSLPVRTFARAIAERAKDARFRFFAWTVACIPLPAAWRAHARAAELVEISAGAHARGGITAAEQSRLDLAVAGLYGLGATDVDSLQRFDRWLRGEP